MRLPLAPEKIEKLLNPTKKELKECLKTHKRSNPKTPYIEGAKDLYQREGFK